MEAAGGGNSAVGPSLGRKTRRRVPSPDNKEVKGLEAAGGGNSAAGPSLGRKTPGHPTFHTPYSGPVTMLHAWVVGGVGDMYTGLFRWLPTLFGHLGTEIPTSVLTELVPVGA